MTFEYLFTRMKPTLILFVLLLIGIIAVLATLGAKSRSGTAAGLVAGKLLHCPKRPNCICSEYPEHSDHFVSPIAIDGRKTNVLLEDIRATLTEMQATSITEQPHYIAATFASKTFRFIDDFEIRIDSTPGQLHIRSASRVGYSDRGVNRQRVEQFRRSFDKQRHSQQNSNNY